MSDGMEYYEAVFYYDMYRAEREQQRMDGANLMDVAGLT